MLLEGGQAVSRAGDGPHKHGIRDTIMSSAGLTQVNLCLYSMIHLQTEVKGRTALVQLHFRRRELRYSVIEKTGWC